ncbi:MAG: redoxin domain-containing protein [Gemmatimonadetes bacterium]|nr:redoxin domain-containing protein [Gemmatimonadota bacterium]
MRDEIEKYRKAGVQPFGVNPAGVDSHIKYVEKFAFNFPLLSDPGLKVATKYGAVKLLGIGVQRSVVVIGQEGKVVFAARGAPGADESLACAV